MNKNKWMIHRQQGLPPTDSAAAVLSGPQRKHEAETSRGRKPSAVFSGLCASPSLRLDARETTGLSLSERLPFVKYVP